MIIQQFNTSSGTRYEYHLRFIINDLIKKHDNSGYFLERVTSYRVYFTWDIK